MENDNAISNDKNTKILNSKEKNISSNEKRNLNKTGKTNKHRSFTDIEFKKFELEEASNFQITSLAVDNSKNKTKKNVNIKIRSWCGKCFQYFENNPMSKICINHASKENCNLYPCTKINNDFICIRMFPNHNSENRHTHCISKEIVAQWDERTMIQNYMNNKAKIKNERKNLYNDLIERNNKILDKNSISIKGKIFVVSSVKTKKEKTDNSPKLEKENAFNNKNNFENESKIFKIDENDFLNFENKCKISEKTPIENSNSNNLSLNNNENLSYYYNCNYDAIKKENKFVINNEDNPKNFVEKLSFDPYYNQLNYSINQNFKLFEGASSYSRNDLDSSWFNKNPSQNKFNNQLFKYSSNSNQMFKYGVENSSNNIMNNESDYHTSQFTNTDFFKNHSNINSLINAVDRFKMDKDNDETARNFDIPDILNDIKVDCGTNINNSLNTNKESRLNPIINVKNNEVNKSSILLRFKDLKIDEINTNLENNNELLNQKHNNMLNIFVKKESDDKKINSEFIINDSLYKFCNYNKIKDGNIQKRLNEEKFKEKNEIDHSENILSLKEEHKELKDSEFLNTTKITKRFIKSELDNKSSYISRLIGEKTRKSSLKDKSIKDNHKSNIDKIIDKNDIKEDKFIKKGKVYHSSSSSAHSSLIRNKLIFNNFQMINNYNKTNLNEIIRTNEFEYKSKVLGINLNFMLKDEQLIEEFIINDFNQLSNCNFQNDYLENIVKTFKDNGLFSIRSLRLYLFQFSNFSNIFKENPKNVGFELHLTDLLYKKSVI